MRVLWISFFGSWTLPLLRRIKCGNEVAIIVPVSEKEEEKIETISDIAFYYIYFKKNELCQPMSISVYRKFAKVIDEFHPDIIHVHGTEKNLAQVQNYCNTVPVAIFKPRLEAEGMIREMQCANVFLSPTSIDNSPNAVGEAMMVGVPVVTTPVGGELSFLTDNQTTLFAPAGDAYMMAYQIKRVFDDDSLAVMLSKNVYQTALKRHDRDMITKQYIDIYHNVINDFNKQ